MMKGGAVSALSNRAGDYGEANFTDITAQLMTRKDSEKDSDRPHYYSQFWLDVAAGRRIIGAPKPEENEGLEPEIPEPAPMPRRPARPLQHEVSDMRNSDGRSDTIVHPVAEPIAAPSAFIEPETDDFSENDDLDFSSPVEDADIPDVDLGVADEDADDDDGFEDEEEEEEEEEDDIGWGGTRSRKKPRPVRPVKPVPKKPRREPRRGY